MRKVLIGLIFFTGIVYIFFIPAEPVGMKIMFKLIPMMLIIVYGALADPVVSPLYKRTVLAGLIISMIADGVIYWFMAGLVTFFIAHLLYIRAFRSQRRQPVPLTVAVPLVMYGLFMAVWIAWPQMADGDVVLGTAIIAYMAVILVMGWEAVRTRMPLAITGAFLFICSDSFLAVDRFVMPLPGREALVMCTYYAAQLLIASSIYRKS